MEARLLEEVLESKKFGGYVTMDLIRDDADGNPKVVSSQTVHNTVVNQGKSETWRMAANLNTDAWDQFQIGTSGAAVTSVQTALLSPVANTNVTADTISVLAATRTYQMEISYPSGGGSISAANIQEVIVKNQNTSGTGEILMRATFSPVNKQESDKLRITYSVRIV